MSDLYRFLSGEVPGGFVVFLLFFFAIAFIGFFLYRYSTVINKRQLKITVIVLLSLLTFSYLIIRAARPPQPLAVHIAIWPLRFETTENLPDSLLIHHSSLGWLVAEYAVYQASQQTPPHIMFLRPEWSVGSLDSADRFTFNRTDTNLIRWSQLIGVEYWAGGFYRLMNNRYEGEIRIFEREGKKPLHTISFSFPVHFSNEDISTPAEELARFLVRKTGHRFESHLCDRSLFSNRALPGYGQARYLHALDRSNECLTASLQALKKDSSSALNWYATGLAYGSVMLRTKNEKERKSLQNRCEYHLKKAGQLREEFELAYIALARYYLFFEPEPRYLDAEAALLASHALYERDYEIYHLLSFMQKARWSLFGFDNREELLKKAIENNPAAFHSYIELGNVFLGWASAHNYRSRQALEHFLIAWNLRPNHPLAIRGLVTGYDYIGQHDKALELLNRYQQAYTDQSEYYYIKGVVYYHIGARHKIKKQFKEEAAAYSEAETCFKKAIHIRPHGYSFLYLGKLYDIRNQRNEAIEAYRGAMRHIDREDKYREEARKKLRQYFPDVE